MQRNRYLKVTAHFERDSPSWGGLPMKNALAGPGEGPDEGGSAQASAGARRLMGVLRGADPTVSVAGDADGVEELRH